MASLVHAVGSHRTLTGTRFEYAGAQWLSALLETEGLQVRASPASLCCVLEQEH